MSSNQTGNVIWGSPNANAGYAGDWFGAIGGPPHTAPAPPAPAQTPVYGGYGGGYNYAAAAAAAQAAREAAARASINQGYDAYGQGLQDLINRLGPQNDTTNQEITGTYNTSTGQLGNELKRTQNKLANDTTNVQTQEKGSLANLSKQFGNQLRGGTLMLGARGAGDSSATGQLGLALSQAQAQSRGGVLSQANQNLSAIDLQQANALQHQQDMQHKLDAWKSDQIAKAFQAYTDIRTSIEREKAGADLERRQALAALDQQAAAGLSSHLGAIQSNFVNASANVKSVLGQNPIPAIPDTLFQQENQFQVTPIQAQGLPGLSIGGNQPATSGAVAAPPIGLPKKDESNTGF